MSEKIHNEEKCGYNKFQRLKFFHGMLLDDKDFTTEQQYHIEKRKLHNRMLHGWGVVCGLEIERKPNVNKFTVKPGMALDCRGNEILVCHEVIVDLADSSCSSIKEKSVILTKEECEKLAENDDATIDRYIGIRYHETGTSPVPVYMPGDECGKQDCSCSRVKEGFCIKILTDCPETNECGYGIHSNLLKCMSEICTDRRSNSDVLYKCIDEIMETFCHEPTPCPECCKDNMYVGLGKLTLCKDNTIIEISHNECRQHVIGSYLSRYSLLGICCIMDQFLNEKARIDKLEVELEKLKYDAVQQDYKKKETKKNERP